MVGRYLLSHLIPVIIWGKQLPTYLPSTYYLCMNHLCICNDTRLAALSTWKIGKIVVGNNALKLVTAPLKRTGKAILGGGNTDTFLPERDASQVMAINLHSSGQHDLHGGNIISQVDNAIHRIGNAIHSVGNTICKVGNAIH